MVPVDPKEGPESEKVEAEEREIEEIKAERKHESFSELDITAKAIFVWDIKNQETLFELNSGELLPLASITKVLMAALSHELTPLNTEIRMEKEFMEAEGDSGLYVNERWTLKDLLDFSLITSSNDGAKAIASVVGTIKSGVEEYEQGRIEFVNQMNQKAKVWGLNEIVITNETGLDNDEFQSGAYGTAREIAFLFENLYKNSPEILESTALSELKLTSLSNIEHLAKNTNTIVDEIPGILASKTGFTTLAGGNLAVIFDAYIGRPIVVVVLGSTFEDRFSDVKKLVEATRSYINQ